MAALFMLMLGSSAILMRSRPSSDKRAVSVEEMGAPEAKPSDGTTTTIERSKGASGVASAVPKAARGRPTDPLAAEEESKEAAKDKKVDDTLKQVQAEPAPVVVPASAPVATAKNDSPAARAEAESLGSVSDGLGAAGAGAAAPPSVGKAEVAPGQAGPATSRRNLQRGIEQYEKRDFDNARRTFQNDAKSDPNAALWAARSARDGSGKCNVAVREFDAIAKRAQGTPAGDQAALESAKCLRAMGAHAEADARLRSIQKSPTAGAAAKAELESNANRGRTGTTTRAAPAAPAAPAKPTATDAPR
jgi:hypothetical protein